VVGGVEVAGAGAGGREVGAGEAAAGAGAAAVFVDDENTGMIRHHIKSQ